MTGEVISRITTDTTYSVSYRIFHLCCTEEHFDFRRWTCAYACHFCQINQLGPSDSARCCNSNTHIGQKAKKVEPRKSGLIASSWEMHQSRWEPHRRFKLIHTKTSVLMLSTM